MSITIDGIVKYFNSVKVLNNVRLSIETGEMIALLGPSGSGKTTLLRVIAGLDYHDSGSILFNNKDVSNLQPGARKVGFVFQSYALFKHMTVASNVAFGLKALPRRKRPGISLIRKKVYNLLDRVQLCHLADRYPAQLSGGQKQRVALARALAVEPEILLLDEPFGALDSKVRIELRRWLRELHKELRFTGVFVTHDQEEAMEVADRIVVMNNGIIEQVGTPEDVWCFPSNRFVLEFLGEINCIEGEIRDSRLFLDNYCWPFLYIPYYQGKVEIFLRPWDILLSEQFSELYSVPVQIIDVGLRGYYWQLGVKIVDWDSRKHLISVMVNFVDVYNIPKRGSYCYLRAKNIKIYYFDSNTILL